MVTTGAQAGTILQTRVYPVGDLIEQDTDQLLNVPSFEGLIEVITGSIAMTTWNEVGGAGSIKSSGSGSLVVSQTFAVHEEIRDFLVVLCEACRERAAGEGDGGPPRPGSTDRRDVSCRGAFAALQGGSDSHARRRVVVRDIRSASWFLAPRAGSTADYVRRRDLRSADQVGRAGGWEPTGEERARTPALPGRKKPSTGAAKRVRFQPRNGRRSGSGDPESH